MCISFFYIDSKCCAETFRFILVFNRDEFYSRKTESVHFWKDYPKILGGRDLESEYRGTWLAAATNGKIAALLNINDKPTIPALESRGVLVTNFLKRDVDALQYVREQRTNGKTYNGYHLLLFDFFSPNCSTLLHSSTDYGNFSETTALPDGVYGISNSTFDRPFKKVEAGKEEFERVIKNFNHINQKETLIKELLRILKSKTKYFPDPNMVEMKIPTEYEIHLKEFSSIFVRIRKAGIGTRTHTILLVDYNYVGYFHEFSMVADGNAENAPWIHNQFNVKFGRSD